MCGIFCYIEKVAKSIDFNNITKLLNHRGPDSYGLQSIGAGAYTVHMLHTRLKINGNDNPQPLISDDENVFLIINGEIFNYKELEKELGVTVSKSDCEILLHLYERYRQQDVSSVFKMMRGQFAFVLYDKRSDIIFIGRDHIGIVPLYIGKDTATGNIAVSSELKCLTPIADKIDVFYPRRYIYNKVSKLDEDNFMVYKDYLSSEYGSVKQGKDKVTQKIRELLISSVKYRIQDVIENDVEFGVLLSGGLDSSLIASLVVSLSKKLGYNKKIKTFTIGVNDKAPDVVAARTVAEHLGTKHHEYYFTLKEGFNSIKDVIWHIESYDCTTVRASTPMYLLAKKIKKEYPNLKVLYSGELSDELMCYLYGANAPSIDEFQKETMNLVSNVHLYDCLRANKTCMAHSIEIRVPFTDETYVDYILKLDPKLKVFGNNASKNVMEKQILRDAFKGFLPDSILYRKKEQFSDGVSGYDKKSNWIDYIKSQCDRIYNNYIYQVRILDYSYNRPNTKEELYYRQIFCALFHTNSYSNTGELTVKRWIPKWCDTSDPSGRVQKFWEIN